MNKKEELNRVVELIKVEKAVEAKKIFDKIKAEESVEYFMVKGQLKQKFQQWGEAMNAYSKVVDMAPDNEEAKSNLHLIQNILNFWNPEMFNP